jgi:hypothetical protein
MNDVDQEDDYMSMTIYQLNEENQSLKKERNAYYAFIMTLITEIENEFQEDGWCKLVITKEKLDDIKVFMESIDTHKPNCTL